MVGLPQVERLTEAAPDAVGSGGLQPCAPFAANHRTNGVRRPMLSSRLSWSCGRRHCGKLPPLAAKRSPVYSKSS